MGYRRVVDEGVCDHDDGVTERVVAGCKAIAGLLASPIFRYAGCSDGRDSPVVGEYESRRCRW